MYKYFIFIFTISLFTLFGCSQKQVMESASMVVGQMIEEIEEVKEYADPEELYERLGLEDKVDYTVFEYAYEGFKMIEPDKDVLTVIDFSKPSTQERMFVIDLEAEELLFSTLVAHGKNSGVKYATNFSNVYGSYKSSLGFYKTESTYQGKNGYSLILDGLERGINDKAKERAIVIHGSKYCNTDYIKRNGRLGRSLGCPALPYSVSKDIINVIKDGSLLFIYANDADYLAKSDMLRT